MTPAEELKAAKDLYNVKIKSAKLTASEKLNFEAVAANIKSTGDDINRWNVLLSDIVDITDSIRDNLTYIASSFKDSVNELSRQNVYLNAQKSALNKLADIAVKILNIRRGDSELDTKKLAKLRLETTERIRQLEWSKKQHNARTAEGALALTAINDQIKDAFELYKGFDEVLKVDKAFNKEMGLSPGIAAGLDKALQRIGMPSLGIAEALSETRMLHQEAESTGQKINLWKTFSGKVLDNFTGLFTKANLIQSSIIFLIDAFQSVDSSIGNLAKGFDMSYNSAAKLRMELTDIANLSGDVAVTTKGLQESMMAVGNSLGSNAQLNEKDLVTFTKLREQAGYTNEELVGIQKLTLATGGNLEDNAKSFLGTVAVMNAQNKLTINAKQLLKEVANVSDSIKLSIGGTTEKLAEAAFKAKQFGINLAQADQMSSSLLDFESSINNEISAELITGKDLNLEKARLLALNGDIAGSAEEILKQVGGTAEFTKMNRIQQEALAKAVGLSRDDLAKSLVDREALQKLGAKEGQSAQQAYNAAVAKYGVEKANAMLGDEALANQFQQQSLQERFMQTIEKIKELFVSLIEPLMPVFDIFADIMKVVGPIVGFIGTMIKYTVQWGKYLLIPLGIMKGFQLVMKGIAMTQAFTNGLTLKGNVLKTIGHALTGGIFLKETQIAASNLRNLSFKRLSNASDITSINFAKMMMLTKNQTFGVQVRTYALYLKEKVLDMLGLSNSAKKLAILETQAATETIKLGLGQRMLATLGLQDAVLTYQLAKSQGLGTFAALRAAMEQTILGRLALQGLNLGKNLIKYIALTLQAGFRMVMENTIVGALLRQGAGMLKNIVLGAIRLAQSIGTAIAAFAAATAETFGIGVLPLLALAAAAGAAIYGITKIGDANFPGEGQGPERTITSKGTMYEPHPTDNIYVTPQKMVAVGNASFKGNGGATNTSPNQFPPTSTPPTVMYIQNNPMMLKNTLDNYDNQRVTIA